MNSLFIFLLIVLLIVFCRGTGKPWYMLDGAESVDRLGCCTDRNECLNEGYVGIDAAVRGPWQTDKELISFFFRNLAHAFLQIKHDSLNFELQLFRNLSGPTSEPGHFKPLITHCNNDSPQKGTIQAATYYKNNYIVFCSGNQRAMLITPQINNWRMYDINVTIEKTEDCGKHLPKIICEGNEKLIDLLVLSDEDQNEIVIGFYGQSQIGERRFYVQEYVYKIYNKGETITGKYQGELSAITTTSKQSGSTHGVYMTNNGDVCPFVYYLNEHPQRFLERYSFFSVANSSTFCRPVASFLQCPQPWCYDQDIDSSFTVLHNNESYVYIIRGMYYWRQKVKSSPFIVPQVKDALSNDFLRPARLCRNSESFRELLGEPFVPCIVSKASAAFKMIHDKKEYVFMYEGQYKWHVVVERNSSQSVGNRYVYEKEGKAPLTYMDMFNVTMDATWYNEREEILYLFQGKNSKSLKFLRQDPTNSTSWEEHSGDSYVTSVLYEFNVKSVVVLPETVYFFDENTWYLELETFNPEDNSGTKKLSMKSFFRIRSECYYNDVEAFNQLLKRRGYEGHITTSPRRFLALGISTTTALVKSLVKVLIVVAGVAITIPSLIVMFVLGKRRKRRKVVVLKKAKGKPRS